MHTSAQSIPIGLNFDPAVSVRSYYDRSVLLDVGYPCLRHHYDPCFIVQDIKPQASYRRRKIPAYELVGHRMDGKSGGAGTAKLPLISYV